MEKMFDSLGISHHHRELSPTKERKPIRLTFVLFIALACSVALFLSYLTNLGIDKFLVPEEFNSVEESVEVLVSAYNRYSLRDGPPGREYEWLKGSLLAEPYQMTQFSIIHPNSNYEYESKVIVQKTGQIELLEKSSKFSCTFENLEDRLLQISMYGYDKQGNKVLLTTSSYKIYVRYVRREIRALFDDDLDELLDTMKTLWVVSQNDGENIYGAQYKSIITLLKFHLKYASAEDCDHLHDGFGFLTQHTALTMAFEQSLQSVNPKISLPYWDYTMDVEKHAFEKGKDFTDFINSELFSAKYFGATDEKTGWILDGRWAGLEVPFKWAAGLTADEIEEIPSNAYGHLRSPWSNNEDSHVLRSSLQCGADSSIFFTLPYCEVVDTLQHKDSLEQFLKYVPFKPHGSIHVQIGGSIGCEDSYNKLAKYFDQKQLDYLKGQSYIFHEGAFRSGFLVCNDHSQGCYCPDQEYFTTNQTTMWNFLNEIGFDKCSVMTDEFNKEFIEVICNSGLVEGDNAQASSAYTPEFWPIHPTVERMFQRWALSNPFNDMAWPMGGSWLPNRQDCYGHLLNDEVLMGITTLRNSRGEDAVTTNKELLMMLSPSSLDLPYIYDHLRWDYCQSVGFKI